MFAFCVIITISMVGLVWFRSFEENLFVLLNTDPEKQANFFAERAKNTPTLFASVQKSYDGLKATLSELLLFDEAKKEDANNFESVKSEEKVYLLPAVEKK